PLIYALQEQAHNGRYQQVHGLLNSSSHKEEDILSVVKWVTQSQGIEQAMADAHTYGNKARAALYHFPPSPDRDVLDELINFVVSRQH
ncbi:MAG: hypothetical protein ACJ8AG_13135, partial [Ktedonobacteraceae bacterium]